MAGLGEPSTIVPVAQLGISLYSPLTNILAKLQTKGSVYSTSDELLTTHEHLRRSNAMNCKARD
jgi:hypothetical protein